jgi:UDP-N-acetylmuramate--alanine ligase
MAIIPSAAAREKGIPTLTRAEFMGALMADSGVRIGVAGSHGKSSATAMISHVMLAAGKDPTVMCGADVPELCGAYRKGGGAFLYEACGVKESFSVTSPNVAVILNVDLAKPIISVARRVISSFSEFAKISSDEGGSVIVCADDDGAMRAVGKRITITFGIESEADYKRNYRDAERLCVLFRHVLRRAVYRQNKPSRRPRRHNYTTPRDARGVRLVVSTKTSRRRRVVSFFGISRRLKKSGISAADFHRRYAHHPRRIEATLAAAREIYGGRLIAVFEPHTFTRTKALFDDFVTAFVGADVKIFTDIFAARETDTLGVSSEMLAEAAGGEYAAAYEAAAARVKELAKDGDAVLILGAGTVVRVADVIGG